MKKRLVYFINILVPIIILVCSLIHFNIAPFGKYSLGICDSISQFKPMLFDFATKIKLGIFSPYSFNNGFGNPTIFNIMYYLNSPFNFIALLFDNSDSMFFSVIIIKMIITSISMTYYTYTKTDRSDVVIISTLSYIFSSWFLVYYYNIFWLDLFMVFPIFQYGLELILEDKKPYIYIFSLAYLIFSNFYLSFAICIYCFIYFMICNFFYKEESFKLKNKRFLKMSLYTIISLLLISGFLYLLIKGYFKMNLSSDTKSIVASYYTNIQNVIKSLFYGQTKFTISDKLTAPNIACTTIILYNVILFIFNKNVNQKKRLFIFIGFIFVLLSFFSDKFIFVLNLFHNLRGITYRYSFIISFLMIRLYILNSENDYDIKTKKSKICLSFFIIILLFLTSMPIIINKDKIEIVVFLLIFFIIYILINTEKHKKVLLVLITILQCSFVSFSNIYYFENAYDNNGSKMNLYLKEDLKYRIYLNDYLNINNNEASDGENLYFNVKTLSISSSMTYSDPIYLNSLLGNITFQRITTKNNKNNIVTTMLFNIKNDNYYLEKIFSASKNIKNVKLIPKKIDVNQKRVIKGLTGVNNIFEKKSIKGIEAFGQCYVKIEKDKYYFYNGSFRNGELHQPLKTCEDNLVLYYYDLDSINEAYKYLSKNQIEYTSYKDSKIEGMINVDADQLIFTSIPYDKDWDVYIDGKKVKPIKLLNSLMGIDTKKGRHKIKLEYHEHVLLPLLISIFTFIGLIISIIITRRGKIMNEE